MNIGIDIKIVDNNKGIFIKNFFTLDLNKSEKIAIINTNESIHQTLFRKNACVGELKIYQIPVKVSQENILVTLNIFHDSANNCA
jgi:hypothetical protein